MWPVTALVLTIQLISQLKIFDQVYLFSTGGRPNDNLVLVYYNPQGLPVRPRSRAAAAAVVLFAIVIVVSVLNLQLTMRSGRPQPMTRRTRTRLNRAGLLITLLTVIAALLWAFPLYWGVVSSLKPEDEVVRPYIELWPDTFTLSHYVFALTKTEIAAGTSIRSSPRSA